MFQPIDQVKTGIKLKKMLKAAGYDVRDIQEYLHLSCPQSIYRWFKGKILPSVEHLCALSKLLNVHMEDLLVLQGQYMEDSIVEATDVARAGRLILYIKCFSEAS
ncbi:MAG: helix-turn-helix transcriptional regulator [Lachnospiraceae bacterium]|nr:helix-turn-helix transcriptional regulator [Lachnospiraceae bacterium]